MPDAEAIAGQAHSLGAVEAEELGAGRVKAQAAVRAGVMRREQQVGLALDGDDDRSLAQLECLLDRLGQPGPDARLRLQAGRSTTSMLCLIWRSSERLSVRL